ncbi:MAG: IS1595 family transposase [Acidobacteria bacterium]|nr:IS1595 family transposase [Acidobacteriota bacterium]
MSNRKPPMKPFTLKHFQAQFPDDATCLEWLRNYLYPDGIHCNTCQRVTKHHRVASRPSYSCDYCGHHVHPTAGTIFHKSPTPLTTWFYAIYLMAQTRCGISAKQIQRETGVTYKTAWRMFKQIRTMLQDDSPIGGGGKGVEMDEAVFGGYRKAGAGRKLRNDRMANKTIAIGMVERKGSIRAFTAADIKSGTLLEIAREYILPKSVVFTDELNSYQGLPHITNRGYEHRRVNHSARVYVSGTTHTNTIEGFWSLIKRGISGVYHQVGSHYLQSYLNEYSFRYNRRFDVQPMFLSFLQQVEKRDTVVRQLPAAVEPF